MWLISRISMTFKKEAVKLAIKIVSSLDQGAIQLNKIVFVLGYLKNANVVDPQWSSGLSCWLLRSWMRRVVGSNPGGDWYRIVSFSFVEIDCKKESDLRRSKLETTTMPVYASAPTLMYVRVEKLAKTTTEVFDLNPDASGWEGAFHQ